jgi:hypothetical protein
VTKEYQEVAQTAVQVVDICLPLTARGGGDHGAEGGKHGMRAAGADLGAVPVHRGGGAVGKGFFMPAMCMRFWPGWAWLKKRSPTSATSAFSRRGSGR